MVYKNIEKKRERDKRYYKDNHEKIRFQWNEWSKNHPENRKKYRKKYHGEHPEKVSEYNKKYRKKHPEKVRERNKKYYNENREKEKERWKTWYKNNIEKYREYKRSLVNTPQGRINSRMSVNIRKALKGNKAGRHWEILVGYDFGQFKRDFESKFTFGMGWHNMDLWDIDHIIPKCLWVYDTVDSREFRQCWCLANLQPMWRPDNSAKGNKV